MEKLTKYFDLSLSESAKALIIDAVLMEAIEKHNTLKIWKEVFIKTDTTKGIIDYLVAPKGKVYQIPLLCVVEAKKDDFEKGMAQCILEMKACQWFNNKESIQIDIYGIVSNGYAWQFYKLTPKVEILESETYSKAQLEVIIGILNMIFNKCEENLKNLP